MRHPIDIATMFAALWLLGSMVVDLLTPNELTIYMIAAATAPAFIGAGLCYYFQVPRLDFAVIFATLWLMASLAIECISPKPLPGFIIGAAIMPPALGRRNPALASVPFGQAAGGHRSPERRRVRA